MKPKWAAWRETPWGFTGMSWYAPRSRKKPRRERRLARKAARAARTPQGQYWTAVCRAFQDSVDRDILAAMNAPRNET